MTELPPGFVLEGQSKTAPPPGFVVEGAQKAQPGGWFKTLDDLMRSLATGVPFADEFAATMSGLTGVGGQGGGTYEERLSAERARNEEISPYVRIPGQITGGLATTVAAAPFAAGTKAGQLFSRLPSWLQTTGLGGLWGALYGASEADPGGRLEAAAVGAPLGAVTGGVLHGATVGARGAGRKVGGYLRARRDPEAQAARVVGEKIRQDQITPARVRSRLKELGPQATIADAGGENVLGAARGVAGIPGPAKQRVMQTLETRAGGEAERIRGAVTRHLGPGDYFAAEEQFLAKLQQGARDAYTPAYQKHQSIMTPRLKKMLDSQPMRAALKEASEIAEIERASGRSKWLGAVDKELTEMARFAAVVGKMERPSRPGLARGFSLETWDHLKRGLDSLLDKPAYKNELTGKLNKKGAAINTLKKSLVKALDRATGGDKSLYAKARQQYAGDAEVLTALREGSKFFRQSPEEIRRSLAGMSEAAKQAYRNGAARAVLDVVENTPDQASAANRLFNKSMTRKKIQSIFPSSEGFLDFSRRMVAEQRFAKTRNAIGSGSRTAPMQQETSDIQRTLGNIGAVLGSATPGGGHALVKSGIGRRMAQGLLGDPKEMNQALAKMLLSRNRAEQLRALDMLAPYARPQSTAHPLLRGLVLGATQQEAGATGGLLRR